MDDFSLEMLTRLSATPRGAQCLDGGKADGFHQSPGTNAELAFRDQRDPLCGCGCWCCSYFYADGADLQSGVEVQVPKTRTVKEITEDRLVLTIDREQRYSWATTHQHHQIPAKLRQKVRDPAPVYYLRADKEVPFGAFAALMDSVKQAGISNVSIVTEP